MHCKTPRGTKRHIVSAVSTAAIRGMPPPPPGDQRPRPMTSRAEGIVRSRLDVSDDDLQAAASAVDEALGVSVAREAAAHGRRKDALQLLHGENLIGETCEGRRGSCLHKRRLEIGEDADTLPIAADDLSTRSPGAARPRRRSGRSSRLPAPPRRPRLPVGC